MSSRGLVTESTRALGAAFLSFLFALPAVAGTCYVTGDTSANHPAKVPGSSQNPYGSLAQVEVDSSCKEIIVLYSEIALDGGIALKDGQKLVGKPGPAKALPIISNSSDLNNGGHTVSLATNNKIEFLHIRDSFNSAVIGTEVGEFEIRNSLITSFAQSETPVPLPSGLMMTPPAIDIRSASDIDIDVQNSEIADARGTAVRIIAVGGHADIDLKNVSVQNLGAVAGSHLSPGIMVFSTGNAHVDTVVKESSVRDIGEGQSNSDAMLFIAYRSSAFNLLVDEYNYSNPDGDGGSSATGLEIGTELGDGARFDAIVRNSTFEGGTSIGMQVIDQRTGNNNALTIHAYDNEFFDSGLSAIEFDIGFGATQGTYNFTVENNYIVNPGFSGIELYSVIGQQAMLNMLVQKNTIINSAYFGMAFSQFVGAGAAILNLDAGGGSLGSIGRNSIIGSQDADILVQTFDCCGFPPTPPFEVFAANNWWGTADGPANVVELGVATVDVTPFLTEEP